MAKKKPYLTARELCELVSGTFESHYGKRCIVLQDRLRDQITVTVMEGLISGGRGSETVADRFHIVVTRDKS